MLHDLSRQLELSDRLETDYLRILYYEFPHKLCDSYRSYEYARLCTILQGEKMIEVNRSVNFKYGPGDFMLLPPRSDVHMTVSQHTSALVFEISDSLVREVCEKICVDYDYNYDLLVKDQILCAQKTSGLADVIGKINDTLLSGEKNAKYILDLYAQEMVYNLMRIRGARQFLDPGNQNPVNRAIRIMKEKCNSSISIADIASACSMSEANFCRYFKKMTDLSPGEYLTGLKMEKARELLASCSVTDTAYDLGYENISYFIALFKAKYGQTPKQYQKLMQN